MQDKRVNSIFDCFEEIEGEPDQKQKSNKYVSIDKFSIANSKTEKKYDSNNNSDITIDHQGKSMIKVINANLR